MAYYVCLFFGTVLMLDDEPFHLMLHALVRMIIMMVFFVSMWDDDHVDEVDYLNSGGSVNDEIFVIQWSHIAQTL